MQYKYDGNELIFVSKITIYADGGTRGNQKTINISGWGVVIEQNDSIKELYGSSANSTNNIMELTAVIKALEHIDTTQIPIEVYSDSKYVVDGINEWSIGWIKRGWIKSDKKPVLNKELWQHLVELRDKQKSITFHWVKGHANNEGNILADSLANKAMDEHMSRVNE